MKHILITIAAVLVVGCGESQSPEPPTAKAPDISIQKAAEEENIETVKQHLADGVDVNARDDFGLTPLHEAAGRGHKEIVKLLIQEQADVHAKNNIVACRPILGRQPLCGALRPPQAPAVSLSQRLCPHRLPAHFVP